VHIENQMSETKLNIPSRNLWTVPSYELVYWQGRKNKYCLVIPVINEGPRLFALLERINALKLFEIIDIMIIDGGSTDDSLKPPTLKKRNVRALLVKISSGGLSSQLRCVYAFALDQNYSGIITIDGNNKDDPSYIPQFIKALDSQIDFVQASRYVSGGISENTPSLRKIATRWIHAPLLSLFSGFRWTDTTQGFRAYSRRMLIDTRLAPFRDSFVDYELLFHMSYRCPQLGFSCQELPSRRTYPAVGPIPTKISGVVGNLKLFVTLLKVCFGLYNPR